MILYHGSNTEFDVIDLNKSKPNKDFGKGFYVSADLQQANEMAKIKVEQMKTGIPTILSYQIDDNILIDNTLNVKRFTYYSSEWAEFIVANRNNDNDIPVHNYDVVIGPIANDKVGVQLWKYENNIIDIKTLIHNLKYMKGITIQYFFGTQKAINHLKKL
ncbi:MAG: DUF3990 domain-containing protein [Bacteroidales bacterium]|nr:DUF3990 domain-containing protein [Bacteroidales bacterium]